MAFLLDKRHRLTALSNLKSAFGNQIPHSQRQKIARDTFIHFGRVFLDMLYLASLSPLKRVKLMTVEGEEHIHAALQKEKGALLFSAHFGLWELAPAYISNIGKLNVIARPLDNIHLEKELAKLRQSLGAKVIHKFQASRPILRSLRANEMVAILIDQNVLRSEAVFIDFFGQKAATTPSLATFHLRTGAPLIPVFCYPGDSRGFHIKILKPLDIPLSDNFQQDLHNITQTCTQVIESQIRKFPQFWFWFHDRWKSRPPDVGNKP
jgi:KDO2-lipid IV(A) lauroyltransferase